MPDQSLSNVHTFTQGASQAAEKIREFIENHNVIHIVSHLDADGIAAASIFAKTLTRMDALFRIRIVKQLDLGVIKELANEGESPIIFTDLGSGTLNIIKSSLAASEVVILDHHQPVQCAFPKLVHVNPHLFGLNGSQEISGAGVAYTVAKSLDSVNRDLAPLAIVGAIGDSQDRNQKRALIGLNQTIVKEASDLQLIKVETDLLVYGRETRPLHKALAYTTNPYMPGLSGEEDKCLGFLINLDIDLKKGDQWRTINDLSNKEKKTIFSEIVKLLSSKKLPNRVALSLIGEVYTLIQEDRGSPLRDAREYASLFNACGRMEKSGLGIAIGSGNRDQALDEVQEVYSNYKKLLAEYMRWVSEPDRIKEFENIYIIDGRGTINENILSTVTSIIISSNILLKDKPLIGLTSTDNGMIKLSGRATPQNLEKDVNLSEIFQQVATQFTGTGGGHDAAAGAQLPPEVTDESIKVIDRLVGASLQRRGNE